MELHAEHDAESEHVPDQRTASIADKRQRNPGDWQQLDGHADVLEHMERNHRNDAGAYIGAEGILQLERDFRQMVNEHEKQDDDCTCPDKTEIFRNDGEDEVGMVLRHIDLPSLIAFPENFS